MMPPDPQTQCLQACQTCHQTCMEAVAYCLAHGATHTAPRHLTGLLDCAQICQTAMDFMLRKSELHGHTCLICAVICEHCAENCQSMEGDPIMLACAEVCRRCAEACKAMSAMA